MCCLALRNVFVFGGILMFHIGIGIHLLFNWDMISSKDVIEICNLLTFYKISFRNIIRVSSSLDPDQSGLIWVQIGCIGFM